ncbi:MAG: glycosyltransferase family 4 protein [Rhodothermales bacterium]
MPRASLAGKRIAIFTGAYNHIADGSSLTLNRLVAHLEHLQAHVQIFAPTIDNPPINHVGTLVPVPSFPFPGRPDYPVSRGLPRSIYRQVAAFNPMMIHIASPDLLGRRGVRLGRQWGIPVVASCHTHFTSYLKYYNLSFAEGFVWWYLRWFYGHCRHIYVPSEAMASVLRSHGITEGLRLWQRGVDTSLFHPGRRSQAWRGSQGIGEQEVVIAFVGRLVWEKGLAVFAEVLEVLRARGIPHRSLIVGEGPIEATLRKRLPETTFTGYLRGEALARAYASSDVFLFPSETETFGNVTLEAMASGLPTVCADALGSRSLVVPDQTGYLAVPGVVTSFAECVERLVLDAGLRRRMGGEALRRAQGYNWDAVLDRIAGYYQDILCSPRITVSEAEGDGMASSDLAFSEPVLVPTSNEPVTG